MKSLETREGISEMLQDLFAFANVSNRQVAKMLEVNEKTVRNWLEGYSEPSPSTLVKLFHKLDVPMAPFIQDREEYTAGDKDREEIIHYVKYTASKSCLHDMNYSINGKHGSSVSAQIALVSMINHMNLSCRLMIAKMTLNLWEITKSMNGIDDTGDMPDVDNVRSAIIKSHLALEKGRNSYTDY